MASKALLALALALFIGADAALNVRKQPISEAERKATGDTGDPCPASGAMLETCNWYESFVRKNKAPPKSLKEPYIHGGTPEWHGPDSELKEACEGNYNTICVQRNPLCDEYFDLC